MLRSPQRSGADTSHAVLHECELHVKIFKPQQSGRRAKMRGMNAKLEEAELHCCPIYCCSMKLDD